MDRYSTSSAESQGEYQRTVGRDERRWRRDFRRIWRRSKEVRRGEEV
jgi:hypothetical protein